MSFFRFGGTKIFYKFEGDGFPILFVHGMLSNYHSLEPFTKKLDGFSTILVDLPGHGKSKGMITSVMGEVYALRSLMSFLEIEAYSCVGYSFGAGLCSILNRTDPRVKGLVVVSPVVSDFRPLELWFSSVFQNIIRGRFSKSALIESLLRHGVSKHIKPVEFKKLYERASSASFVSLFYDALLGAQINTGLNLLYSHNPLLVISGRYDILSPPALVKKHLSSLAEFHIVDKGHADIFPEDLYKRGKYLLQDFFKRVLK